MLKNPQERAIYTKENDYNELKLDSNKKQSQEVLNEGAVKSTIQLIYDRGSIDFYDNSDKVLTE